MNIQFGNNKNNTNRIKKIYNQGDIITARPQTSKYPYKILSIKESPRNLLDDILKIKNPKKNSMHTLNNIYTIKKSFSYVGTFLKGNKIKKLQSKKKFNKSFYDNNYIFSPNRKADYLGDNIFQLNNESNEKESNSNRKYFIRRGYSSTNCINKKKVSSYSMSKYVEKYINKNHLNNSKSNNNIINKGHNNDLYQINFDDNNNQIIHFLSEVINTEILNNNGVYKTTNNISKYNVKKKTNTRNLIIQNYYNNFLNKINENHEIQPIIIQQKNNFIKENHDIIRNNLFLKSNKNLENESKLKKNKSYKIANIKNKNENEKEDYIKQTLSIETEKTISKRKHFEIDKKEKIKKYLINSDKIKNINNNIVKKEENNNIKSKEISNIEIIENNKEKILGNNKIKNIEKSTENNKEDDIKKNSNVKYRIKNGYKKKFNISKEFNKSQKKKWLNSHVINNDNKYLKCCNNLKNGKYFYFIKNNFHRIKQRKNDDIYDYLILPKESEKNNDILNKDYLEFKPDKQ
jgi:hypothetical protein